MALDNSRVQLRTITFISAGAALIAVIGYLLMKSNRKRKPSKSIDKSIDSIETTDLTQEDIQSINNKLSYLEVELSKTEITDENLIEVEEKFTNEFRRNSKELLAKEDHVVPVNLSQINNFDIKLLDSESISSFSSQTPIKKESEEEKVKDFSSFLLPPQSNEIQSFNEKSETEKIGINLNEIKELSCVSSFIDLTSSKEEEDYIEDENSKDLKKENIDSDKLSESSIDSGNVHNFENISPNANIDDLNEKNEKKESNEISCVSNDEAYRSMESTNENQTNASNLGSKTGPTLNKKSSNKNITRSNSNASVSSNTKSSPSKSKRTKNKKSQKTVNSEKPTEKPSTNIDLKSEDKYDIAESDVEDIVVYEFNFPRKLCGKLIGKNGVHVDFIRSKTNTQIAVRNDTHIEELQIVCVSGRISDVDKALDIIGQRFPSKMYPQISFKPITKPIVYRRFSKENIDASPMGEQSKILVAQNNFVNLTDVISKRDDNETIPILVTSIMNAGHVFVQLPTHPTYNELQTLDKNMLIAYDSMTESVPNMNEPIEYGTICAAPTSYGWHRAMVTNYQSYDEITQHLTDYNETCGLATVKFLDYGGYLNIPVNQLRQLRSDFMVLPFQIIECYLDGIYPHQSLLEEGKIFLSQRLKDSTTDALITGYSEEGIPQIKLFISNNLIQNYCVNNELEQYGLAISYNKDFELNTFSNFNQNVQNLYINESDSLANIKTDEISIK